MGLVRVVRRHLLPETVIRGGRSLSGGFGDLLLKHTTRLRSLVLRDQCKRPAQFRKELSALYRGDRFRPGREQTYREHLVPSGLRGGEGKMQRIQARDSHRQACPKVFGFSAVYHFSVEYSDFLAFAFQVKIADNHNVT